MVRNINYYNSIDDDELLDTDTLPIISKFKLGTF